LESTSEDDARVVMGFDGNGQGLVALDVDGQIVQLLATLSADDRARGARVRSGDVVRVSSIDAARNRCIVRIPES
jgi:translation initiation factor IF-1